MDTVKYCVFRKCTLQTSGLRHSQFCCRNPEGAADPIELTQISISSPETYASGMALLVFGCCRC
eukprot:4778635-Amphidinium_carterae.2